MRAILFCPRQGQQKRERGAAKHQHLHVARKAVSDENAVEQHAIRRRKHHQRTNDEQKQHGAIGDQERTLLVDGHAQHQQYHGTNGQQHFRISGSQAREIDNV